MKCSVGVEGKGEWCCGYAGFIVVAVIGVGGEEW